MKDIEKLGVFYLGRRYDAATKRAADEPILYDSKDLVTHALCVGMTGSGKTGLGIALIEEAAIDGVPVIVIDPKGDLTNLLLTFPQLRPEDFAPWVDADEARRAGKSQEEFAAAEAAKWAKGLADWGQDGARIQRLRDAAEFTIYTPGSTNGIPVSVLSSFAPPPLDDAEQVRDRVQTTVSSLLALAGVDADPVKSREHILLSTILLAAWQAGESPDVATLVQRVQKPPMTQIGAMHLDAFFPEKDRFAFAMAINGLIAAPGFETWMMGDPLDAAALLRTPAGKPRVSIFCLAHLSDGQRMFFVSLLLNAVIGWMRAQSGTSSLRALLYMDEIFGFFPPTANPPSKAPLLTLLKQGRAAGLGVVLATQNPVDLDYKGLSNIGTWWLGRLQTERDKARVLDGLESASDGGFDRAEIDRLLNNITSRVFLMRNVHEDQLTLLQSRWALSYLRGPLSRDEIKRLMADRRVTAAPRAQVSGATAAPAGAKAAPSGRAGSAGGVRPSLSSDVPQAFLPGAGALQPVVYAALEVRFTDAKLKLDIARDEQFATTIGDGALPVDWATSQRVDVSPDALETDPPAGATFQELPAPAAKAKNYPEWGRQLVAWVSANEAVTVLRSPSTGEVSNPDESERDFRARLQHGAREARDEAIEALRKKYAPKQAALDEKLRRAQQAVARESQQATGQKLQTAISVGATLVSAFLGRKAITVGSLGRATTAARGVGRTVKESEDVTRAQDTVEAIQVQRRALDDELASETAALEATTDATTEKLESIVVKPKKGNITLRVLTLLWRPIA